MGAALVSEDSRRGFRVATLDPTLVKAIVRGRRWFEKLASGHASSLSEIAAAEGVTDRYVGHLLPLAFLAPEIVSHILAGTQPPDLTAETLVKRVNLPVAWSEQKTVPGVD